MTVPAASGGLYMMGQTKRSVFVSYHHAGDQQYYDTFSTTFSDVYNVIYDNSLERRIDSDDVNYVIRRIRENHITGTSCTIVLVGRDTWGRKYVDWEIDATLEKQHGLIGVQLPTLPANQNGTVTVPARLSDNINSGYALWVSWAEVQTANSLSSLIETANSKSKTSIRNDRQRRYQNA
jgi:hypothetical protein